MKRSLITLILLVSLLPIFGSSYDFFHHRLSFTWFTQESLYPESTISPFSATSTLNMISLTEGQPRSIRYTDPDSGTYEDIPFLEGDKYADETMYLQLKTGINIGFFRLSLPSYIETEMAFQGALNTVFQGFGGADTVGFDGAFFFGFNTRWFDRINIRAGFQHYSGHYGDETLLKIGDQSGSPVEYVRDNNLLIGISVNPASFVRLYVEASSPMENTWMKPSIHIPLWVIKRTNGQPLHIVESEHDGVSTTDFADAYRAWILNGGVELSAPIPTIGAAFLALDVLAHQDGQTLHMPGGYDSENPWEFEYTIGAGIEFSDVIGQANARILVTYHDGRFPLLNFHYLRSRYFGLGFFVSS